MLLATVAGLALSLAFEPVAWGWISVLSMAAFVGLLRRSRPREALVRSACFGLGFTLPLLWWLAESIGVTAWLALATAQAAWVVVAGVVMTALARLPGWPVWTAAAWTTVELARSAWPFGGFPWGRLGFAVLDTPGERLLPLVGPTVAGMALVTVGGLVAWAGEAASSRDKPTGVALPTTVGVVLVIAGSAITMTDRLSTRPSDVGVARVVAVQGGVPGDGTDVVANSRQVTGNHVAATHELGRLDEEPGAGPTFVVWPENATAADPLTDPGLRAEIDSAVAAVGVPVLVGAVTETPDPAYLRNQSIEWTPAGPEDRYTKQHLVPFGEWIPFRRWLDGISPRLAEVPRDMLPGRGGPPIDMAGVAVATALCFDVAYDDVLPEQVRDGAELAVVQTSNASFTGTYQLDQQFAITRARALETRRYVVVASLNGISGLIGPDGEVIRRAPLLEQAVLDLDAPRLTGISPAIRFREWWTRLPALLLTLAIVWRLERSRRGRRRRGPLVAAHYYPR